MNRNVPSRSNAVRDPSWARLKTTDVPIAGLNHFDRHARRHPREQIRDLARSIEHFGFNTPVLIDEMGTLLAGHARVEAARRLGWDTVPAIEVGDLTPAEKRAFVLADNRLCERGRWDEALLAENLQILDGLETEFDLDATGFSVSEIDQLLDLKIGDNETAEEAFFEPVAEPISRQGDLWILGKHRLFCGDALERASYEHVISDGRARLLLTDPPYNIAARTIGRRAAREHGDFLSGAGELDDHGFMTFLTTLFQHVHAVSVDGALAYVFMDWRHARHVLAAGHSVFDELKNICVWAKTNAGMGSLYRSQHELVFVFKVGRAAHVNTVELGKNGRHRSNVWQCAGANGLHGAIEDASREQTLAAHPTVKPVRLLADAILDASRRGEIVLDPFLGSGSTLMACERTGRVCRGIELDPRYADTAIERWQAYTGELARHDASGASYDELREERRPDAPRAD